MEETAYETLIVRRDNGVVRVVLNRPEKKNAINGTMFSELRTVFDEIGASREDRVLVLSGAGGDFCSGADLSGGGGTDIHPLFNMDGIHAVALSLHRLAKPAIACVDGVAVGAGCNLALGCDLVLASSRSRFAEIFVRRGLSVDFGGSWILPRLIGLHRAKMLALTGDIISAQEAADIGLINKVVETDQLEAGVESLVQRLLAGPPVAQALIKRLLNEGALSTMAEALDAESSAQAINSTSADAREARDAFMAKREPKFTGR
jgi:2-(1,2-epoxy-1,2-dihydrophenyl)acetyl-CoA isomerase